MATKPSTSTTPMNVPTPSTKHMVANAAKVIMEYTDGLQFNNNAVYWWKAVDVVWGQLWHVEAVVGDLPASFIMPTYIIAVDCFMVSPETLQKSKTWPPWDNIYHAQDQDVQDHPWFKLQKPVVTEAMITMEMPTMDKGKGDKNQEDVLHPEQGWTDTTVDTNSNGGAGPSTTVVDLTAPDGFSAVEDAIQCNQCARQGQVWSEAQCSTARHAWSPSQVPSEAAPPVTPWPTKQWKSSSTHPTPGPSKAKVAQMEWPSWKNFEVYIKLPPWMPKSKLHDTSITSTIAVSAMNPPTTPTGTATTTITYQECLEDVEEDMFLLKWDYIKMKLELDETHQEVEILECLWSH
ncbi:hypothetical protein V8B97DRAFT_1917876 [Scleroderma yunnanense]